eukprot:171880-Prorocentrum_minimum.AAC.1
MSPNPESPAASPDSRADFADFGLYRSSSPLAALRSGDDASGLAPGPASRSVLVTRARSAAQSRSLGRATHVSVFTLTGSASASASVSAFVSAAVQILVPGVPSAVPRVRGAEPGVSLGGDALGVGRGV